MGQYNTARTTPMGRPVPGTPKEMILQRALDRYMSAKRDLPGVARLASGKSVPTLLPSIRLYVQVDFAGE
jgi:hypothetical protein